MVKDEVEVEDEDEEHDKNGNDSEDEEYVEAVGELLITRDEGEVEARKLATAGGLRVGEGGEEGREH